MSEKLHNGAAQGAFSSQQQQQQQQSQPTSHPSGFIQSSSTPSSSTSSQDRYTYTQHPSASNISRTHEKCGPTATAPFLQDFNLVAEAAKRAQMAVVMRDLENVSL